MSEGQAERMAVNDKILFEINERMKKGKVTKKQADEIYGRFLTYEKKKEENIRSKRLDAILDEEKNPRVPKITDLGKVTQHKELKNRTHEIIEVKEKRLQEMKIQNELMREKQLKEACTFTPKINKYKLASAKRDVSNPPPGKPVAAPQDPATAPIHAADYLDLGQPHSKRPENVCALVTKAGQHLSDITFTEMPFKQCEKRTSGHPQKKKPANAQPAPQNRAEDEFERKVITVEQLYSSKRTSQLAQKHKKKDAGKATPVASKSPLRDSKAQRDLLAEDKENLPMHNLQASLGRSKSKAGLYKPGPLSSCNYSSINAVTEDSSMVSIEAQAGTLACEKKPAKEARPGKCADAGIIPQPENKAPLLKNIPEKQLEALLEELMNQQPGSDLRKLSCKSGQSYVLVDGKKLYYTQDDVQKVLCHRNKDN